MIKAPSGLYYASKQEVDTALKKNSEVIQLTCHTKQIALGLKTSSRCQGLYQFTPIRIPYPGFSCNWIHYLFVFVIMHSHSPNSFKLLHLTKGQIK